MSLYNFEKILAAGKPNSLGRVQEVIDTILSDPSRLSELFECIFSKEENVRLRAGDALEKIARVQPLWIKPYTHRLLNEVSKIDQSSVKWHLAQMLGEIELAPVQKTKAIKILSDNLKTTDVDWIVAGYSMETLAKFVRVGFFPAKSLTRLLKIQQQHHSKSVIKRADKLLAGL